MDGLAVVMKTRKMPRWMNYFSHLDNLGHAARLVGLLGVERVCEHLKRIFNLAKPALGG